MAGLPNININFGRPRPRRRRRRLVGGLAGLLALAAAAFFASGRGRPSAPAPRLPSAPAALARLRATELAKGLEQIPATVIDQGLLRRVPYLSHRAGDLEVNLYGDPDAPACLEIGLHGGDPARRAACRDALADLLPDPADRAALAGLDLAKGKTTRSGLTLEVTPETAPDAYGAWWVSAYDAVALEAVRAADGELKDLSQPRPADAKRSRPGASVYAQDLLRQANRWLRRR
jgi:hypothetical protein